MSNVSCNLDMPCSPALARHPLLSKPCQVVHLCTHSPSAFLGLPGSMSLFSTSILLVSYCLSLLFLLVNTSCRFPPRPRQKVRGLQSRKINLGRYTCPTSLPHHLCLSPATSHRARGHHQVARIDFSPGRSARNISPSN